ncbi:alpha/beta hydrolase-fold protein [Thioclava sp. GXIMD2076]|uniref:alpha/beta hydrolase n=1 Tax=Thioclava sp. GXIMD2076 TaxID=3131931 RepID=UPI0030CDDF81
MTEDLKLRRRVLPLLAGLPLLLAGRSAKAEKGQAEVRLDGTEELSLPSDMGDFVIRIAYPEAPAPAGGYGVIYALDAGWSFGTLRDAVRLRGQDPARADAAPVAVVAIGWPARDLVDMARRTQDLTGAGVERLLGWMKAVLMPEIETRFACDPAQRMICGHSFGGSFALQARRLAPGLFSHVAAGSPSIWTDPQALLGAAKAEGKLFISIGGQETAHAAEAAHQPGDRVARIRERDMMGRARLMAEGAGVPLKIYDGLSHGASATPFYADAVSFLRQA